MKRILALLAVCLLLAGCAPQVPTVSTLPTAHTTSAAPTNGVAETRPTVPRPTGETAPPVTEESLPPSTEIPSVTEPGPQILYGDPGELSLTAKCAFVYDCSSEDLWILGDLHRQFAPASLVKLFTIHVAMQYLTPEEIVTAGDEVFLVEADSSLAAVRSGNRLTAAMLVEGCLVQSGNDAAYVLAAAAGKRLLSDETASPEACVAAFVAEMNRQAAALGLRDTYYVNPDGYDAPGQSTSAADILTVAKLSLDDPLVLQFCGIAQTEAVFESGEDYLWQNTNLLLHEELDCYCPDAFGLKTGTTDDAGGHLVAAFHAPGRDLIIGIFGCPDRLRRFDEALLLYRLAK